MPIDVQSQQPDQQTFKQDTKQPENHEEISKTQNGKPTNSIAIIPLAPSPELKKTTGNPANNKKDDPYKKWWEIRENPVEVFTGMLALLTLLLVLAGWRQVAISRDIAQRQLRAYVFIDTIDIWNIITPPIEMLYHPSTPPCNTNVGPMVRIVIRNSGQTPAYDVHHYGHVCFSEYPATADLFCIDEKASQNVVSRLAIPPEGKTFKELRLPTPLTNTQIDQLRMGTHAVYVDGNIKYRNTFGKSRFTNFRYFINNRTGEITWSYNPMTGCEVETMQIKRQTNQTRTLPILDFL